MIEVYKYGASVKIRDQDIKGFIIGIQIKENDSIIYEVSYFYEGEMKSYWFFGFELDFFQASDKIKIGYLNND